MYILFQSSMPRSGSTLLQNILHQNPLVHSTPTDGLIHLLNASRNSYNFSQEFKAQEAKSMESAFISYCKGGAISYAESLTDRPYFLSKSRSWIQNYDFLNLVFPNPKMICIIRDLRDVICSMEKNFRKHPMKVDTMNGWHEGKGKTVLTRTQEWLSSTPVGHQLDLIYDAIIRKTDKNILFIRFEDLCDNPQDTMDRVYAHFEMDSYKHDFNNIEQSTHENDEVYGIYGDHKIKPVLMPNVSRATDILGIDACNFIYNNKKWYFDYFEYDY